MKYRTDCTPLWSIGTAVPRYRIEQDQVLAFMRHYYSADARLERQLNYIYRRSHINRRYTCCSDFTDETRPAEKRIFSSGKSGTEERMRIYAEEISTLAAVACRKASSIKKHTH